MSKPETTDLLDLLRREDVDADWTGPNGLFQRAADEIQRLRLRLAKIANAPVPTSNALAVTLTEWAQPRDGESA